jgi:hypothetical protein
MVRRRLTWLTLEDDEEEREVREEDLEPCEFGGVERGEDWGDGDGDGGGVVTPESMSVGIVPKSDCWAGVR